MSGLPYGKPLIFMAMKFANFGIFQFGLQCAGVITIDINVHVFSVTNFYFMYQKGI